MYNTYFYHQMFNQTYVNPIYYQQHQALVQQYQLKQTYEVTNAVKSVHDLCEAIKKMDAQHQEQAFYLCLAEMAEQFGWNR